MDKKKELIIRGAIKRFTHYGINKTTMNEIADDLSVSKPSLYYYFPDKGSLVHGVIHKIFTDYFEALSKEKLYPTLEATLLSVLEIKFRYFQKYYMLHLSYGVNDSCLNSDEVKRLIEEMKKKDLEFHAAQLQNAMNAGEIEKADCQQMAELYLQSLAGITSLCVMNGNKELLPNKKDLKLMHEKQQQLSKIFIKGLKS
ncbi:TetR/AcrR family transcriptional regulator [Pedobacter sp.]|uniref:TetR/AcrR family transcriptional regulator n=1 Tax=Pedobacter sp. TaxID=1411316 RepID=UPI003D7F67E0